MEMQNAPVFCFFELLPYDAIITEAEKSSCVLRDEVIKEAVSCNRCLQATKFLKQLWSSQHAARGWLSFSRSLKLTAPGKPPAKKGTSGSKPPSQPLSKRGKGKRF